MRGPWTLLALGAGLLAGEVQAKVTSVELAVVTTDPTRAADAAALRAGVVSTLASDPRLEVRDARASYATGEAAAAARAKASGTQAVSRVKDLVAQLEYESARAAAENAAAELRSLDFRVVREAYLELLIQLARVKKALVVDDQGDSELTQAFIVEPELSMPRGLNTAEREWFEQGRARARTVKVASPLTVEVTGGSALVWVDGRLRGVAPVRITDVPAGRHFVTVEVQGGEVFHRSELFGSLDRIVVEGSLTAAGREYMAILSGLASAARKGSTADSVRELLEWTKADEVMVVVVTTPASATVQRTRRDGSTSPRTVAATAADVGRALLDALEEPLRAPGTAEPRVDGSTQPSPAVASAAQPPERTPAKAPPSTPPPASEVATTPPSELDGTRVSLTVRGQLAPFTWPGGAIVVHAAWSFSEAWSAGLGMIIARPLGVMARVSWVPFNASGRVRPIVALEVPVFFTLTQPYLEATVGIGGALGVEFRIFRHLALGLEVPLSYNFGGPPTIQRFWLFGAVTLTGRI